eukprot:gb/GFBE01074043.1/.p1 GENE.gb/GFBE01074043.1/~~gb/GFBE01074043.1/.p1  ORF type:complete len:1044 (+),score=231.64 gb/GFBE01074043.1/:2-3133(+)
MLVEGILNSLQTLFWAVVLLGLTIFIFGVLLVRMSQWDLPGTLAHESTKPFTSLPTAMWTLVQMATFDHWVKYVRGAGFTLGGAQGTAMAVVLLACVCLTGLGIMNLVVGILCHTAFKLEGRQVRMMGAETLVRQQEALELFRQGIMKHGTHLLKNHRYIDKQDFMNAIRDKNMQSLSAFLGMTTKDFEVLSLAFEEKNDVEIDGVIEAIGIIVLQAYFAKSIANNVKKHKAQTALRPVDLVFFCISLRQLESSLAKIDRNGKSLCALAFDALSVLYDRAEKSYTLMRMNQDTQWSPPIMATEVTESSLNVRKMEETANQFNLGSEEQRLVMPIDMLFGSFIAINGGFVGIQTAQDDNNEAVYWIDLGFTLVFTLEFILRGILLANLNFVHQSEDTDTDLNFFEQANRKVTRFYALKKSVRFKIFAPCPPGGTMRVFSAICASLKDVSVLFDFVIITLSLLDSVLIVQLRAAGVFDLDTSSLSVLRVFRLFRLAKLLRIFKLFPQLQKLVFALIETWRQVFWALVLILIILYAFSIYAVSMVGADAEKGSELWYLFGDLRRALLTGWQITTFDDWDIILMHLREGHELTLAFVFVLSVFLGLGLMNMAIGVLCESALSLQAQEDIDDQRAGLIVFLDAMKDLQETCNRELGAQILPASFIEQAIGLKMHPTNKDLSTAGQGMDDTIQHFLTPAALKHGESAVFRKKLESFFQKAGLHRLLVKRVFDKVDHGKTGYITVDDLTKGALVTKEDLAKVELYGCTAALRDVRSKCAAMNEHVLRMHSSMNTVLEEMNSIIQRKSHSDFVMREKSTEAGAEKRAYDASALRPSAEKALYEMARWSGEGPLPQIEEMGQITVAAGTGRVTVLGDEVVGSETAFRTEVQVGDVLMIEPMMAQKGGVGQAKKTIALAVSIVLSQTRLKISMFIRESVPENLTYIIARSVREEKDVDPLQDIHTQFASMAAAAPKQISPRSSQNLFEWDLRTKKRDIVNIHEAEARHRHLLTVKKALEFELYSTLEWPVISLCFQAMKAQVKPKPKSVALIW